MEATKTEKSAAGEIEMEVVEVQDLPEKFRPPSSSAPTTADVPALLTDLFREATSGLTGPERGAFLRRLEKEHPEIFSGQAGEGSQKLPKGLTEEEWREALIRLLKEEANRFMAAAASL